MDEILAELENSVVQVPAGGFPPKEVADDVAKAKTQSNKTATDAKPPQPTASSTQRTRISAEEQDRIMRGEGLDEVVQVPADAQLPKPTASTKTEQEVKKGQFETNEAPTRSIEKPTLGKGQAAQKPTLPTPRSAQTEMPATEVEQQATQPDSGVSYPSSRSIEKTVETTTTEVVETAKDKVTLPTPRRNAAETSTLNPPAPITDADAKPAKPTPPSKPRVVASEGKGAIKLPTDYTGYKIQLIGAPSPLPKTHEIFKEFAFVTVQQTMVGEYLYLIGDFRNQIQAQTFLDRNIIGRFAEAQVVQFEQGKRTN